MSALQHGLITMPIKQFALLADLAYHVCVLEAEVEGQPHLPAGQEWLRTLAAWLLLKLANGWDEARIAETFAISQATVKNVARRFAEEYARVVRLPRR